MKFKKAKNTLILSDLHLTVAEPEHKKRPLWKKFNRKDFFIDDDFALLLKKATNHLKKEIELILAGDIFDFDSVTQKPKDPLFKISWLEKKRSLNSEELKSLYKIDLIIQNHPTFFQALKDFVSRGNKLIFIIGNHDLELHWSSVKRKIIQAIDLPEAYRDSIRFCNWFYISNSDTLVEHGNQYDPYCAILNPVSPFHSYPRHSFVKLPFGNLVHRYMVNGMGVFNPHVDSTYLLTFTGYLKFYFNTIRTQPLLLFDWLFGAFFTWAVSIRDSLMPRIKNPLTLETQYKEIAKNANSDPSMVRTLRELHIYPLSWNIFKIMRILWLDRAILFLIVLFCAFQLIALLHIFWNVSFWWVFASIALFMPLFIMYIHKIETIRPVAKASLSDKIIKLAARITKVSRFICGHTHAPEHKIIDGIEYINSGYWSPSFQDPNCTVFEKNKTIVWIRPDFRKRAAFLLHWDDISHKENPFEI